MNLCLFYDTETTGLYDFKRKPGHPSQPHLVQYAGLLVDPDNQRIVQALASVVNPGVPIPKEATKVHGIATEYAKQHGVEPEEILQWHAGMMEARVKLAVCHNISFDRRIMDTVAARLKAPFPSSLKVPEYCTMKHGTNLCKLPGRYGFKWPKLEELHQHLFKESFPAHDALADVQACARCYFAMNGGIAEEKKVTVDLSAVKATCPLCGAEPSRLVPMTYSCGCQVGVDGNVKIPCAAGTPKK